MRILGFQDRGDFEPDPVKALRRALEIARKLRLLPGAELPRGVTRATRAEFNRVADLCRISVARRVNQPWRIASRCSSDSSPRRSSVCRGRPGDAHQRLP